MTDETRTSGSPNSPSTGGASSEDQPSEHAEDDVLKDQPDDVLERENEEFGLDRAILWKQRWSKPVLVLIALLSGALTAYYGYVVAEIPAPFVSVGGTGFVPAIVLLAFLSTLATSDFLVLLLEITGTE